MVLPNKNALDGALLARRAPRSNEPEAYNRPALLVQFGKPLTQDVFDRSIFVAFHELGAASALLDNFLNDKPTRDVVRPYANARLGFVLDPLSLDWVGPGHGRFCVFGKPSFMTLLSLFREEVGREQFRLVLAAGTAGAANAMLLHIINDAARTLENTPSSELVSFLAFFIVYVTLTRHTNGRTVEVIERILDRIKVRIADKIIAADLDTLEQVHAAEICERITENMKFVSDRGFVMSDMLPSALAAACTAIYLGYLCPAALAVAAILCVAGVLMFVTLRQELVSHIGQTTKHRVAYFERLMDLLGGAKEARLSRRRSREIREDIMSVSEDVREWSVKASGVLIDNRLVGNGILFALLMAVVYTLPKFANLDDGTRSSIFAGVMFLWGPFMKVALGIMPYIRSNIALSEIDALEQRIDIGNRMRPPSPLRENPWSNGIQKIEANQVEYVYDSATGESFKVGPIDFNLSVGEVTFIVGGNGSGKSTLLKVLTGLYAPREGTLRVDGIRISPDNVAAYRDQISAIFTDFHLFKKLHGLAHVDESTVKKWLERMQLHEKVRFSKGEFSTLALSTGQRKRLALVVTLLENKSICVFDEWAADQDPGFRKYFYEELLPELRKAGKIVIAVSHDDRYFHCADRIVTLELGAIRSNEKIVHEGRPQ